ncbi:MAG: PmbA/TldA family metallopeptidase, partial [Candidatus Bathyarchaeia archaeon]
MKDMLRQAAEKGVNLGAKFIDLRLETAWVEGVAAEDGQPKEAGTSLRKGVGVRALAGGSWGFAAADLEDPVKLDAIVGVVERAVKLARGTKATSKTMELAPTKAVEDN